MERQAHVTPLPNSAGPAWAGAGKRALRPADDAAEQALVDRVKKCRVSSTPGELRLKKDLADCECLHRQGIARFDKAAGNPLKCRLTFLCPIGGVRATDASGRAPAPAGPGGIPTTFSVLVPKFYPHDPPNLFADRSFSQTCSFVRADGKLQLPFLSSSAWSSVSTMKLVAQSLLQVLQIHASGLSQPRTWSTACSGASQAPARQEQHMHQGQGGGGQACCALGPRTLSNEAWNQGGGGWNAMHLDDGEDDARLPRATPFPGKTVGAAIDEWAVVSGRNVDRGASCFDAGGMDVADSL